MSLVLVAHVRRLSVSCDVLNRCFFVALLWLFWVLLWLYRGPCLFWTKECLALERSSDHSRPVGDVILNKSSVAMVAMPD